MSKRVAICIIIAIFLINGLTHLKHAYKPAGYRQAAMWLNNNIRPEDGVIGLFRWQIYQFYLNRRVYGCPETPEELKDIYFEGNYRYLVTDFNAYYYGSITMDKGFELGFKVIKPIEDKITPVKLIDNPMATSEILVSENLGYGGKEKVKEVVMAAPYADKIRIYDLKDYFGPKK